MQLLCPYAFSRIYYHSIIPQFTSPRLFACQTDRGISRQSCPFISSSKPFHLCPSMCPSPSLGSPPIGWPAFPCRLACPPCHPPSAVLSHRYLAGRYIIRPGRYFTPAPPDPANNPKHWRPGRLISALCAPCRTSERRACRRHSSFPRAVPTETMGKDGLESLARPHSTASGPTEKCSLHRGAGQT